MKTSLWIIALGLSGLAGIAVADYQTAPKASAGTHWHAKGCDGQGSLVYHADYIDEFPPHCREFILVDDATDKPVKTVWSDELQRALAK